MAWFEHWLDALPAVSKRLANKASVQVLVEVANLLDEGCYVYAAIWAMSMRGT